MRFPRVYSASALTFALLFASLLVGNTAQTKERQNSNQKSTVLFVVSAMQLPNASIVPLVIIDQGQFKQPVAGDSDAKDIAGFASAYYSKGSKYRVLFGGSEAGSLIIKKSNKDAECAINSADVTLQSQARLNRNVMAIATNSDSLGGGKNTRRAPTPGERTAFMPLVQAAYKQKGVPAALLPGLTTVNLTALDLDNDGKAELIGSFVVKKQGASPARYALFLIAEPEGNSYRTTVLQYERYTNKDIMGGADMTAIENGVYLERLVDQLDLDGDGTNEVITVTDGFEGDTYHIYKKQGGNWNKVYEFGNYRCAF
jgi:hypothetical protein